MLIRDHFQNFKSYQLPKAQLIIADVPYNLGNNAYASNPAWYKDGDNKNGESNLAGKSFFDTDNDFRPAEFMHFCSNMLVAEPKGTKEAPCMVLFCEFEQQFYFIELAKRYGLKNYINLVFRKNFSAQVLKANMKIVGNCEYGLVFYRDKLPKFRNNGKMIFNCIDYPRDNESEKIHPCLPAGQKVYFNKKWINIEDVKIGYSNQYGNVIDISNHYAEKLIEIKAGSKIVIATWNHPFLVKSGDEILWKNAELITENDCILQKVFVSCTQKPILKKWSIKKQKRGIFDMQKMKQVSLGLNIALFGKSIMEKFHLVCKFIILILTKQTILLKTYCLSHQLNTSGITQIAYLKMGFGLKNVNAAENTKKLTSRIGIIHVVGLMVNYVKNVILKNQSQLGMYSFQKVGSVKIIQQKTKVYNLTIDKIPVFDTLIGISHNTQKPVKLLEKIIEIFTDPGDVVIDPCAGSGSTLIAAENLGRKSHGFEIKKDFHAAATKWIEQNKSIKSEIKEYGFAKTEINKKYPSLFV
jgi:site-specific DNA-methyltransferase (adenine-specific)